MIVHFFFIENIEKSSREQTLNLKVMYFENIEESSRFILTVNIFYLRGYFCGGILRLIFFCWAEL